MPIGVPDRDEWFPTVDAFPRPDWPAIYGWQRAWLKKDDLQEATQATTRHWLSRLCTSLGSSYSVVESNSFHLLSALDDKVRTRMLQFLETARARLLQTMDEVAWNDAVGKHVVLRFTTIDEYYPYISHFYANGEHATSGGVFLRKGYCHIAYYEALTMDAERTTLAHELAHNLVAHLPLPLWLNEALAKAFGADLGEGRFGVLNRELHEEHMAFWNAGTIQDFWMGKAFHSAQGQRVAYNLAQVLLNTIKCDIRPKAEAFRRFVKQSIWQDAGEAAAREQLGAGLGEIASVFLGEGDWTPKPETWSSRGKEKE